MDASSNIPPAKQKWYRTVTFRVTASIVLSPFFTCLIVIAGYFSQQNQSLLASILIALIPGIVLGILSGVLLYYYENAVHTRDETDRMIISNAMLRTDLTNLNELIIQTVKNAGDALSLYEPLRRILNSNPTQGRMIRRFMRLSLDGPLHIWGISDREFYEMTIEGARLCNTYDAIHHGAISSLERSPFPQEYLTNLQEVKGERRRIVILKKDEIKEVNDQDICLHFLIVTKGTTSYWIEEEKFLEISRIHSQRKLDCALHDKKMLLRMDRNLNVATLSFDGQHEEICDGVIRVFETLDVEINRHNLKKSPFHLIE